MEKKLLILLLALMLALCGCEARALYSDTASESALTVSYLTKSGGNDGFMKAVWLTQFDLHPVYRENGSQRGKEDFAEKVGKIFDNLAGYGFGTAILQVRPNGDSMYESEYYPLSKYLAGVRNGSISYDALGIIVEAAKEHGISLHAWINPLRLCTPEEMESAHDGFPPYMWYRAGSGQVVECDGMLYLNPAYPEVRALICDGAAEILEKYDFDGLHIDDYFYPVDGIFDDEKEFAASGCESLGDFRRSNISSIVASLYETAHRFGKIFGASPAGNLYSLSDCWYADAKLWCSESGYLDYIMPQLYFGFLNSCCPFDKVLSDWEGIIKNGSTKLYIGLSAAKAVFGSEGTEDGYAGSAEGKREWIENTDILSRECSLVWESDIAEGICVFAYSSMFDPLTGEENEAFSREKDGFVSAMATMGD